MEKNIIITKNRVVKNPDELSNSLYSKIIDAVSIAKNVSKANELYYEQLIIVVNEETETANFACCNFEHTDDYIGQEGGFEAPNVYDCFIVYCLNPEEVTFLTNIHFESDESIYYPLQSNN